MYVCIPVILGAQNAKDSVTCFHCGCKSANWSAKEDAWARHARTSPQCQHVLFNKGSGFISQVLAELGEFVPASPKHVVSNTGL